MHRLPRMGDPCLPVFVCGGGSHDKLPPYNATQTAREPTTRKGDPMTQEQQQHNIEMTWLAELEAERAVRITSLQVRNEDLAEAIMQRMLAQSSEQDSKNWN